MPETAQDRNTDNHQKEEESDRRRVKVEHKAGECKQGNDPAPGKSFRGLARPDALILPVEKSGDVR